MTYGSFGLLRLSYCGKHYCPAYNRPNLRPNAFSDATFASSMALKKLNSIRPGSTSLIKDGTPSSVPPTLETQRQVGKITDSQYLLATDARNGYFPILTACSMHSNSQLAVAIIYRAQPDQSVFDRQQRTTSRACSRFFVLSPV
jgi:hypothetical protein